MKYWRGRRGDIKKVQEKVRKKEEAGRGKNELMSRNRNWTRNGRMKEGDKIERRENRRNIREYELRRNQKKRNEKNVMKE